MPLWFAVSTAAVALALAGLAVRGVTFGLEFSGGRLVEYLRAAPVDVDDVREELAGLGLPRSVVRATADGVVVRGTELSSEQEARLATVVDRLGGDAESVRDEFIGPTIGGELRRSAFIALGLALAAQLAYLAILPLDLRRGRGRGDAARRGDSARRVRLAGLAVRRRLPGRALSARRRVAHRLRARASGPDHGRNGFLGVHRRPAGGRAGASPPAGRRCPAPHRAGGATVSNSR